MPLPLLQPTVSRDAQVTSLPENGWRLSLPPGRAGRYRLAQLDDYRALPRPRFLHHPPLELTLQARASAPDLPGTWGFGLWNDPFAFSFGLGGARRLPALPNALWFFFASPHNHLSLRDDLPAFAALAATFRSPRWPALLVAPALLALPFFAFPPIAKLLRRISRSIVRQDAVALSINPKEWHTYSLRWDQNAASFQVDGVKVFETSLVPHPPLGLVLWIDNQYLSFPPNGRLRYGTLENSDSAWLEIRSLAII